MGASVEKKGIPYYYLCRGSLLYHIIAHFVLNPKRKHFVFIEHIMLYPLDKFSFFFRSPDFELEL